MTWALTGFQSIVCIFSFVVYFISKIFFFYLYRLSLYLRNIWIATTSNKKKHLKLHIWCPMWIIYHVWFKSTVPLPIKITLCTVMIKWALIDGIHRSIDLCWIYDNDKKNALDFFFFEYFAHSSSFFFFTQCLSEHFIVLSNKTFFASLRFFLPSPIIIY